MSEPAAIATPHPAATVALLREATGPPELLLLRREPRARFMPLLHVFPGGRIDAADAGPLPTVGRPLAAPALPGTPQDSTRAAAIAAARECFEEAGVLLARDADGTPTFLTDPERDRARADILAGATTFAEACETHRWQIDLAALVPFARWVTPALEPRRFDTLFYLAALPAGVRATCDGSETVAQCWLTAEEALAAHARDELPMAPPTWAVVRDLARFTTVRAALAWARERTFSAIEPVFGEDEEGEAVLLLAGDRLWQAEQAPVREGDLTRIYSSPNGWRGESHPA